jgi:cytochrome c-type biogenesis protein CcmH/NrfG
MIWPLLTILTLATVLFLSAPLVRKTDKRISPIGLSLFFAGFVALAITTYALIGRPDLLKPNALQAYAPPKGPSAEQIRAAQQMSAEDRAQMILSMVEGLAAKLEDNPEDAEGWARLLHARQVLGQTEQAEKDITRVKDIFADRPETLSQILISAEAD